MSDAPFFAAPEVLLLGALTGLVFGFLLHKGGVTRFEVIVGQFRFEDFTVLKIMGTAIVVGGVGVYALLDLGWIEGLHVKSAQLLANAAGGAIFGVGMAVLGYCPGTGVAAMGAGSRDAAVGVLGMIGGAALYAEAYPWLSEHVLTVADLGKRTLADLLGVSPWAILGVLAAAGLAALALTGRGRAERKSAHPA